MKKHFCHYVVTGDLKGISDCHTRNAAIKLNGNNPPVCLTCSAYQGKRKKALDVNDLGPEARGALLNFVGGFLDLEAVLISNGATKDDIRKGALEAIDNMINTDPRKKARILKTFKASKISEILGSDE